MPIPSLYILVPNDSRYRYLSLIVAGGTVMPQTSLKKYSINRLDFDPKLAPKDTKNADEILHGDHLKVNDLFFQFERLNDLKEKHVLVQTIIKELVVHAAIEEQIVYPAVRKQAAEDDETANLMDESETEHHILKLLMSELLNMSPHDKLYNAKVCVLSELVRHHVREEEKYMFAKMKDAGMDLEKLGQRCLAKKEELQSLTYGEISDRLDKELQEEAIMKPTKRAK